MACNAAMVVQWAIGSCQRRPRIVEVVDCPFTALISTQGLNLRPCVGLCWLHAGKLAIQKADLLLLLVQTHLHGVYLAIGTAGQNERTQKQGEDIRLFHCITLK
ncbi:MAG: hypothetical protein ACLTTU_00530 [Bilophila wadsworthia]